MKFLLWTLAIESHRQRINDFLCDWINVFVLSLRGYTKRTLDVLNLELNTTIVIWIKVEIQ